MSKFEITVAHIAVIAPDGKDSQVRVTFQIDREPVHFQVAVLVSIEQSTSTA
jgi:hypothetical protein